MLPSDPIILLSFVNTKLRDEYDSLDDFCAEHDISTEELEQKLAEAGFRYDPEARRFH